MLANGAEPGGESYQQLLVGGQTERMCSALAAVHVVLCAALPQRLSPSTIGRMQHGPARNYFSPLQMQLVRFDAFSMELAGVDC